MKFVKQPKSFPIRNVADDQIAKNKYRKHGELFPNTFRCIICGPSNSGKTNILINLLENPNGLHFENIYIFSKSLHQTKYKYLERILKPIKGLGYFTFKCADDLILPEEAKPNSVFIFDDVMCDNQDAIRSYFCMGRHYGLDSFYLAQTYTRIPKHLIRDNANFFILFKQDDTNIRHIYNDCAISCDMSLDDFRYLCGQCWNSSKYNFLVIDLDCEKNKGRYRRGFDEFVMV